MSAGAIIDVYPLSPIQEGLLFHAVSDPESRAYFVQMRFEVTGALDERTFAATWQLLCDRHDVLRTSFVHQDLDRPLQAVHASRPAELHVEDLRSRSVDEQHARIEEFCSDDRARGFDLQRDVLSRIALLHLDEQRYHLVWSYHHLLLDGWSLGLLQREFAELYASLAEDRAPQLPPAQRYREYIAWLGSQDPQGAARHFTLELSGYETAASVPAFGASGASRFEEQAITLDDHLTQELVALAARSRVTLSTLVRGLWGVALARYNDASDVVFGAVVSGRPAELDGVERIVGPFINTLPVRVTLEPNESFAALLTRLQMSAIEASPFHHARLAEIASSSALGRALFDHVLVFDNYPTVGESTKDRTGIAFRSSSAHDWTHYAFSIVVVPGEQLHVKFLYDAGRYGAPYVERIAAHFEQLARRVTANPDVRVGELDVLTASEHEQLRRFGGSPGVPQQNRTIVDVLEAQAARTPEAIALRFGERSITYRELNEQANFVSEHLRSSCEVNAGDRVGIVLDRSDDLVVAIIGVLKCGAAYVPVDPNYPQERAEYLLADSGVRAVLRDVPSGELAENPRGRANAQSLAYVLYTSGSTGEPKGVLISHESLLFYLSWANGYYFDDPAQGDFALFSSISFDLTVTSLFLPLMRGRTLTILAQEMEPAEMLELMFGGALGVDTVKLTPSHVAMLEFLELETSAVRLAIVGGEAFTPEHAQLLWRLNPAMRIVNEYGPTEATVGCIVHDARPGERIIPIGRPIFGSVVTIRDRRRQLVPIGVPGEIFIGGPGVACGYHNRTELENAAFSEENGSRMYRTGDIGRWLENGEIEYLGRSDDQVKIRGHRIELGEVESALQRCDGVSRAAVALDGTSLVGYVEARDHDVHALREALRAMLPEHMLPARIVFVERMPLGAHGKIDRARLTTECGTTEGVVATSEPRDELEQAVAQIWSEVLGRSDIAVDENFFHAGGHSLKAMQVVSRIRKQLEAPIILRDFLIQPTIAASAALIRRTASSPYAGIPRATPQADYPLSHAQERLWLIHAMGGEIAYNMPEAFLFEDGLDFGALRSALGTLLERHDALRTSFVVVDGEPRQRVAPRVDLPLAEIDLRGEVNPDEAARAFAETDATIPFSLEVPPLLRMTVMRVGERRFVVLLTIHHIVGDGWSCSVLKTEMQALYAAYARGETSTLRPLRIQYADFAVWQRSRDHADSERYWVERLAGCAEAVRLPYDMQPEDSRDFRGATVGRRLDPALVARLREFASSSKTTLSNAVLAAFALTLWQSSRQDDFCIGVSEANRDDADLETLIGFFVNILPIRVGVSSATNVRDLFADIVARMSEALEHRDYPFDLLVRKLNPGRVTNRQPLLNVVYGFQSFRDIRIDASAQPESFSALAQAQSFTVPFRTSKFDLCLFVSEVDDTLLMELEYDTGLFRAESATRLLGIVEECARLVAEQPEARLGELAFHRGAETQALFEQLRDLNATTTPYERGTTVHELFSHVARMHPQGTAVAYRQTSMTYEELDRRSNDIAALLIDRGVRAEEFVGVLLDRSPHMIVAILGVMKAGAAYVPLESSMPRDRLRHVIDDTQARWLIFERAHLRVANRLHWESSSLESVLCIDSDDVSREIEDEGGIMEEAVWEYVAHEAFDDISGGGWKDSYTGEWLSRAVMDEYGDNIREKLRPLLNANARVLEIGCATGISMFRLAPLVGRYVGTDLSPGIVAWSEREAERRQLHNVRLHALPAHEVDRLSERDFDVVILNSVIECFPGHNYVREVLRQALALMSEQGYIFLGNLWDQDLKAEFERSLHAFKREYPERSVNMKLDRSDELFVSRAFIDDLRHEFPEIEEITYSTMIGNAESELSRFGFDAVLRIRKGTANRTATPRRRQRFDRRDLLRANDAQLKARGCATSLAYMMYTSGTSGRPKGVMIEHRAILRLVRNTNYIAIGPDDAVLQCGALGFDASTFEIWGPLLSGGCVVLPEGNTFLHPADLARTLRERRVSVLFLTTGLFNNIVDLDVALFGTLRVLLTGGEQASATHFNRVRERHPNLRVLHVYGPTENTTFSTFFDVTTQQSRVVPIGRPIANTTAVVVNEAGVPVPFGSPGELYVGGDGLARGYWHDDDLTARKFVADPIDANARMYRTGDLVRMRRDGEIEYVGRIDTQIKIRGFRIELEELEGALLRHDLVAGAAVVAQDLGAGETELVAFVTGTGIDVDTLRDSIKAVLPEYLVPSRIMLVPKLPLNANGKVDRKRLVVPMHIELGQSIVEPVTQLERQLADVWARLLNHANISVEANFFALGGHSLKVARMVSTIQSELGFDVPLSAVFRAPTIRELARYIGEVSRVDRRLIEDPLVALNGALGNPVFAFPPGSGYCLSYLRLGTLLPHPLLGFGFLEADSRMDEYVSLIRGARREGPLVLFGYSAGGKLAFAVAQELERRGVTVSDVVIFDASVYLESVSFSDAEIREVAAEFLDEITSRALREQALQRIKRYRTFLGTCVERGSIAADIHLVVAEGTERIVRDASGVAIATLDGWQELTTGRYHEYRGNGTHREMLTPPHLERNADILRAILAARPVVA